MKSIAKVFGSAALGLALLATTAQAQSRSSTAQSQSSTPIIWNVGVGLSMPSTNGYNTGFNVHLGATVPLTDSPVWIRPEAAFDHFGVSNCGPTLTDCGNLTLFGLGADAGYTFETEGNVVPYVLGGLQITHQSWSVAAFSTSRTKLGINLGGGITFPLGGQVGYLELRYVATGDFDMIPLTFGLRF